MSPYDSSSSSRLHDKQGKKAYNRALSPVGKQALPASTREEAERMATCLVDDISVECEGGCGLICTSTQCWSWCEPTDPVVVPAIMALRRGSS
jgi:hypothetical protein